jgi:regulator of protease activity HflC (stomatin/prohibitin superfamily)
MIENPWSLDGKPPPAARPGWWGFIRRHFPGLSILLMSLMLVAIVLWPYMIVTVPSGQVGVLWKRFSGPGIYCWCILARGTVLKPEELRDEGLHVIWPWDTLFIYNLRLQSTTEKYNAISSDGVSVTAEINIRYQLNHDAMAVFHKFIGPGYVASLLRPEIGSQARDVIANYSAREVYLSRQQIEDKIKAKAQQNLGAHLNQLVQPQASEQEDRLNYQTTLQKSIQVLDTLVLSIELPPAIVAAINRQTEQFYMIQEYKYRVLREAEESKRKQIEADGIAAFQQTVSQGISDSYLRWRGIEATLQLAQSTNAKVVVIGTGRDGLPIILGNVDAPSASPPAAPSDTGGTSPPSKASPAATEKASAISGGAPPGSPSPGGAPSGSAPSSPATPPVADSSSPSASPDKAPSASSPLALTDLESFLSKILAALRAPGSDTSTVTGAKPK